MQSICRNDKGTAVWHPRGCLLFTVYSIFLFFFSILFVAKIFRLGSKSLTKEYQALAVDLKFKCLEVDRPFLVCIGPSRF